MLPIERRGVWTRVTAGTLAGMTWVSTTLLGIYYSTSQTLLDIDGDNLLTPGESLTFPFHVETQEGLM